jgi:uncharacterized membrane protein
MRPSEAFGGAVYVIGVFVETMVVNVPMNNALDAVDSASEEGAVYWRTFLRRWTAWNHVRALAGTAASVVLVWSLL